MLSDFNIAEIEQYKFLFEDAPLPMWIYDIISLKFLAVNNAAVQMYGYSAQDFINMTIKDIRPREDISSLLEPLSSQDKNIKSYSTSRHIKKDGSIIYVDTLSMFTIFNQRKARFVIILNLIDNQKNINILNETEQRLKSALDNMNVGFQIISPDWRYLYVNDVVALQGRASKEKLLGAKMTDVYPGIENTEIFTVLKSCLSERVAKTLVNEFQYSDGTSRWFSLNIEPVHEGVLILSSDITNLKIAESEVSRLNRVYSVLSKINHSIVHIKNKQQLLNTACNIATDEGKFKIAIVTLMDKSSGQLKRVAMSGCCRQLLDDFSFSNKLLPFWSRYVCEVINTGNPRFINNIESVDPSEPWRNQFLSAGCHSNAIFPLKTYNNKVGAFSLFSPEKNFFEKKEISLLTEMIQDISFALESIENAKRKVQAENELLKAKEKAEEMNKLKKYFFS